MRGVRRARDDWKTFDRGECEAVRLERGGERTAGVQQILDIAASQKRGCGKSLRILTEVN